MTAHIRRVEGLLSPTGLWDTGFQFGDWLDPDAPPDEPWNAKADTGVVATACCSAPPDHRRDRRPAGPRRRRRALRGAGRARPAPRSSSTTSPPTAPSAATAPPSTRWPSSSAPHADDERAPATAWPQLVAKNGYRVSTGFAGTPFITDALTETGHIDDAYGCCWRRVPVLALPGDHGRHHGLGALGLDAAGRHHQPGRDDQLQPLRPGRGGRLDAPDHRRDHRPLEPGYAAVRIAPRPGGGLTWAKTALETARGWIEVAWRIEAGSLTVRTTLPPGVTGSSHSRASPT